MPQFKKILKSQRGGKILIDQEGYLYNYLRETSKGSAWACRGKYKLNCNARIYYTEYSSDIEMTVNHNHLPKIGEARTIELLRNMKSAKNTKYCYKLKKELMKGVSDSELDQKPPTLLNTKLDNNKMQVETESDMLVDELANQDRYNWSSDCTDKSRDTDVVVDVDTDSINVDISQVMTQETPSQGDLDVEQNAHEVLQNVIGQLLNEPELLQGIVSSLTEHERDTLVKLGEGVISDKLNSHTTTIGLEQSQPQQYLQQVHLIEMHQISNKNHSEQQTNAQNITEQQTTTQNITEQQTNTQNITGQQTDDISPSDINTTVTSVTLPPSTLQSILPATSMPIVTSSLPNTIISNQVVYKRMGQFPGSTIYFTPPALNNPYCRQCCRSFTSSKQLDDHYIQLQSCEMCKIAFCVPEHYQKHMEYNHPDGIKSAWGTLCETCGRVFGVAFQLDSHRAKCSNRLSLRCPKCFYSFGFEEDLKRHKEEHGDMLLLKCQDCSRAFPTELGLQAHIARKAQNKGPFPCPICDKLFCLKCDFGKHVKAHINDDNGDPMVCKFCTQIFSNPQQLLQHEASHLDVNICKFCGVKCMDRHVLLLHEKSHLNNVVLQQESVNENNVSLVQTNSDSAQQINSDYFKEMESLINSL